jgi:hypothetical protein
MINQARDGEPDLALITDFFKIGEFFRVDTVPTATGVRP